MMSNFSVATCIMNGYLNSQENRLDLKKGKGQKRLKQSSQPSLFDEPKNTDEEC